MPTFYGPPSDGTVIPAQLETALAADIAAPESAIGGAVRASADPLRWQTSRAFDITATPRRDDLPQVSWVGGTTTALTTPVEYAPKGIGGGTKVVAWAGQDDPVFQFFPGSYSTGFGTNEDIALFGDIKPGGASQAAGWPIVWSVNTSATDTMEIVFQGPLTGAGIVVEVNGRLVDDTMLRIPSNITGSTATATLKFPSATARNIRVWGPNTPGLRVVRVPTGQTLTKPAASARMAAIIGDSFVNGAGNSANFPDQGASALETFAPRLLRTLGYNRQMLAGIGGTGWQTANPFSDRVPIVLDRAPNLLVFFGSVNDGGNPAGLKTAVANTLAQVSAVPDVIVVPPGVPGYEGATQQIKEATLEAGRTYIDWHPFFTGTGTVTDKRGDGNRDVFRMADGTHPTLDGQRAMARVLFHHITEELGW